jgi:hypothetical protein
MKERGLTATRSMSAAFTVPFIPYEMFLAMVQLNKVGSWLTMLI